MGDEETGLVEGTAIIDLAKGIRWSDELGDWEIKTDASNRPSWIQFGDHALPEFFWCDLAPTALGLPRLRLTVEALNSGPVCIALQCTARRQAAGGQAITGAVLRHLPIGDYVTRAAAAVAIRLVTAADGTVSAQPVSLGGQALRRVPQPDGSEHFEYDPAEATRSREGFAAEVARSRRRTRRGTLTEEDLRQVAEVYRGARARQKPPRQAVQEAFGPMSPATAGRYVQKAREHGHLGKARPRQPGEIIE